MKSRISFYILLLFGLFACSKDKVSPLENSLDCEPFDLPDAGVTTIGKERFEYKAPYFNPNNSNEFIYHYRDNEQQEYLLYKYDLQTQQKTLVAESGKIWGQPKWSSNGWIAYTHHISYVDHIFIVKENGDSQSQITSTVKPRSFLE